MKKYKLPLTFVITLMSLSLAYATEPPAPEGLAEGQKMYVIEREIPGAGDLSQEELVSISQTSCAVLNKLGPQITWIHSYVTGDKIYCVYAAPSKELVKEHAEQGGFPANSINEVNTIISPDTASVEAK